MCARASQRRIISVLVAIVGNGLEALAIALIWINVADAARYHTATWLSLPRSKRMMVTGANKRPATRFCFRGYGR